MEETRKRKHAKESEGEEKNEDQMKEENGHYEGQVTNKDDSGKILFFRIIFVGPSSNGY